MLDRASLGKVLGELASKKPFVSIDDHCYRSIALRHFLPPRTPSPLRVAPSGKIGTRFVPPMNPIMVLYLASDAETAHREGNQVYYQARRTLGRDPWKLDAAEEVVILGIRVRLANMLVVSQPRIARRLGTTAGELRGPWKTVIDAPTQRLGEAVYSQGSFEGIIYDSSQNPGHPRMVIFPDRLQPGSIVEFKSKTPGVPDDRL